MFINLSFKIFSYHMALTFKIFFLLKRVMITIIGCIQLVRTIDIDYKPYEIISKIKK